MAYSGYLLKAGGTSGTEIPLTYMKLESYKITPNQRLETSAERDADGLLVRETVSHSPSKVEFETRDLVTSELSALMAIITGAYTDVTARKLTLQYYVPDLNDYQEGTFYVPDIPFTIYRQVSSSSLHYKPVRIAFIEY